MSASMSKSVDDTSSTLSHIIQLQQQLDQQLAEDINEKQYWKRRCEALELELKQYRSNASSTRQKIATMSSEVSATILF